MADASPEPQFQSQFVTRLPREVRDGVYLELWRSCGLRQHVIWHDNRNDRTKSHFCRWECTTPFDVQDKLQENIDRTRIQLGVPLGQSFTDSTYALQLFSGWKNHWACGERLAELYSDDIDSLISQSTTTRGPCWSQSNNTSGSEVVSTWSSYISMILSCKLISSECLKSIYESTTFIFTDTFALNVFIGCCKQPLPYPALPKVPIPPPAFRKYGRQLELSLSPVFTMLLPCSSPIYTPIPEERHNSLDFHGLRLDLLESLTTLHIWVAARSTNFLLDFKARNLSQSPYNFSELTVGQLINALSQLQEVKNITISIPLHQCTEPEDGYIREPGQPSSIQIWRRGAGDRYHPGLYLSSDVWTSEERYVKLAYSPETIGHVRYATDWGENQPGQPQHRGRVARFMDSIRSKGKWLREYI